jgi:lysophospholipase L1-like esterase
MSYKLNPLSGSLDYYSDAIDLSRSNYNQKSLQKTKLAISKIRQGAYSGAHYQGKILCIGDSTTVGTAGNHNLAWPECMARYLSAYFTTSIDCFFGPSKGGLGKTAFLSQDTRFALGSAWHFDWGVGFSYGGNAALWPAGSAVSNFSFTPSAQFDRIDIYNPTGPGWGAATVNVDGGSALGTLDFNSAYSLNKQTINCTLGTHTINVVPSNTGHCAVTGAMAWKSTASAMYVINGGASGWKIADLSDNTYPWNGIQAFSVLLPDLTIINMDINDSITATDLSTYAASYAALVNAAIAAGSDVILVSSQPNNGAASATIDNYRQVARNLSTSLGIPHIDLSKLWASYSAYSTAGFAHDENHPNDLAHDYIARTIGRFIIDVAG